MQEADAHALEQAGFEALRRRDLPTARAIFERMVAFGHDTPRISFLLARACDVLDDRDAANAALDRILANNQRDLRALLMKGDLLTRDGDDRAAISWYERALRLAPAATIQLPPDLAEGLRRARAPSLAAAARSDDQRRGRPQAARDPTG